MKDMPVRIGGGGRGEEEGIGRRELQETMCQDREEWDKDARAGPPKDMSVRN